MSAMGLSYVAFILLRCTLPILTLLLVYIISGCWILSMVFLYLLIWSCDFYSSFCFYGLSCYLICIYGAKLATPGINPTWSWYMIFLMYCWIWFANIFWEFWHVCSSRILACNFLFFIMSLSGFGILSLVVWI